MFKVGDLVVLNIGRWVYRIDHIYRKAVWLDRAKPQLDIVNIDDVLRHATQQEIAAGRRNECEVLDMVDVSPNCEVRNG